MKGCWGGGNAIGRLGVFAEPSCEWWAPDNLTKKSKRKRVREGRPKTNDSIDQNSGGIKKGGPEAPHGEKRQ